MSHFNSNRKLERDFEIAKNQGRWLSDQEQMDLEQRSKQRTKLIVLTGVCVLLPPLWPFALGLTLYLLFPKTTSRIGIVATIVVLLAGLVLTAFLLFIFLGIFNALF